jgi:hypothetical protein
VEDNTLDIDHLRILMFASNVLLEPIEVLSIINSVFVLIVFVECFLRQVPFSVHFARLASIMHRLHNQSVQIVQQARFLRQLPLPVHLVRLASIIHRLENQSVHNALLARIIYRLDKQSVKTVQQASIWELREQHKVQHVETVK